MYLNNNKNFFYKILSKTNENKFVTLITIFQYLRSYLKKNWYRSTTGYCNGDYTFLHIYKFFIDIKKRKYRKFKLPINSSKTTKYFEN